MEYLVSLLIGFAAWQMTSTYVRPLTQGEKDAIGAKESTHNDLSQAGINWGQQRTVDLHLTHLNSAFVPYSAPTQTPTQNLDEIFADQADRDVFLEVFQPSFYFRDNVEMPLTSAAAGVYNVEIPGPDSIRYDPNASLATHPRTYVDNYTMSQKPYYFTGEKGTMGASGAMEPVIWEETNVPPTGQLNFDFNPYGPGGNVQNLMNNRNEVITRARGTNRSTVIGPPLYGTSFY